MSNEFDYTPPPECGHKAYQTDTCAHCIYVVMQAEAKMYIYERDHAEARLEHVTRVLANTQRTLGEVLAERQGLRAKVASLERSLATERADIADGMLVQGDSWDRLYDEHAKAVQQRDKAEARAADLSRLLEAVLKNAELKEKTAELRKQLELK